MRACSRERDVPAAIGPTRAFKLEALL